MDAFTRLKHFLRGEGTDRKGRTLAFMLEQSDDWLEEVHDFVQWLFPATEVSRFNRSAPVLTQEQFLGLSQDTAAVRGILRAFERMLAFYGLERWNGAVVKAENWAARSQWAERRGQRFAHHPHPEDPVPGPYGCSGKKLPGLPASGVLC